MRILLTNDDGIAAPGIQALWQELAGIGEVMVVAPDIERSAASQSITVHHPIRVDKHGLEYPALCAWRVGGTPTDCVKIALESLLTEQPDIVVSGINQGPNLGTDVLYSGTVSAAIEGALYGIPSIAVSLTAWKECDFGPAARFAGKLAVILAKRSLPPNTLLNVNVPAIAEERINGVEVTKLGVIQYANTFERRQDPRGRTYYWMGGRAIDSPNGEGTDVMAVKKGYISVTPIHFDLTNYAIMDYVERVEAGTLTATGFGVDSAPLLQDDRNYVTRGLGMDNLTHGLVGYAIYKLSAPAKPEIKPLERRLLLASILASEAPDLDMVSAFLGNGATLMWHRTYTHSFVGLFVLAAALTLIMAWLWPALPRRRLFALAAVGSLLHGLLDLLNSYGTKILLPWRQTSYAWDLLPIIDPWLLAGLAILLAAGYKNCRRSVLWIIVVLMVGYIGWRAEVHDSVAAEVQKALPGSRQIIVMPVTGSVDSWRFAASLPAGYSCGAAVYHGETTSDIFIPDIAQHPAVLAAQPSRTVRVFRNWARLVAYKLEQEGDLFHVTVLDPRYASPGRTIFSGHVWLDASLQIVREEIR